MKSFTVAFGLPLAVVLALAVSAPLAAQDKEPGSGQEKKASSSQTEAGFKAAGKLHSHSFKLQAGKYYLITVKSQAFEPEVMIVEGDTIVMSQLSEDMLPNQPQFINPLQPVKPAPKPAAGTTGLAFVPKKTATYRVLVSAGPFAKVAKGPLDYTIEIVERKAALSVSDKITANDPMYPNRQTSHHKVYTIKLEANKIYQIDMISQAMDSYLFLEDPTGQVLDQDDDGGGYPNARIIFRPTKTDTYRIIATTFAGGATGPFTLTAIENPSARLKQGGVFPGMPFGVQPPINIKPAPMPLFPPGGVPALPAPGQPGVPKADFQPKIEPNTPKAAPNNPKNGGQDQVNVPQAGAPAGVVAAPGSALKK